MMAYLVQNIAQVFMIKMGDFYDSFRIKKYNSKYSKICDK